MSATSEQILWSNYQQNNKFIETPHVKIIIQEYETQDNIILTNYVESGSYNIIKNISASASGSILMTKLPSVAFTIDLFTNDSALISNIKNFLKKGLEINISYHYSVVPTLYYVNNLILDSFNVSDDGTTITINASDICMYKLNNSQYNGEIKDGYTQYSHTTTGTTKAGRSLLYAIYYIMSFIGAENPTNSFIANTNNGLVLNMTKAEALQYILQACMGSSNNRGACKIPALPIYTFKQVQNSPAIRETSFILSNGTIVTDISSSVIDYDNNKTGKYIIKPLIQLDYPSIEYLENPRNLSINVYSNETSSTSSTLVPVTLLSKVFAPLPSGINRYTDTISNASYVTNVNDIYAVCYHNTEFGEVLTDIVVTPLGLLGTSLVYQVSNPTQRTVVIKFYVNKTQSVYPDVLYEGNIRIGDSSHTTETITINYDGYTYGLDDTEILIRYDTSQISNITDIVYYNDKIVFTATRDSNVSYNTDINIKVVGTKITTNVNQLSYEINENGTYDIEIDNPLITTKTVANNVAKTIQDLLCESVRTISVKCRLDPSICLFSIIKVIDKLGNEYYVWVNEYNYVFNGGFAGNIKGLIIDSVKYLGILTPPKFTGYIYDYTDFDLIFENKNNIPVNLYIKDVNDSETIDDGLSIPANSYVEITPENADYELISAIGEGNLPLYAYFQSTDGRLLVSEGVSIDED